MTHRRLLSSPQFLLLLLIAFPAHAAVNPPQVPPRSPSEIPSVTTQNPDGQIFFPASAATRPSDNTLTWQYKPTRWGMYELVLIHSTNNHALAAGQIQIAGQTFKYPDANNAPATGNRAQFASNAFRFYHPGWPDKHFEIDGPVALQTVQRFYLPKADPFELVISSADESSLDPLLAVLLRPAPEGKPIVQDTNSITLHARDAVVSGIMLRYEPATNKNCLGYWTNPNDSAVWFFEVTKPGAYDIELWQGCGKGQGGSEASLRVVQLPATIVSSIGGEIKQTNFTVEDTGHFQNFISRALGTVTFHRPGPYALSVKPLSKKAAAVMDIRKIVLKPSTAPQP